MKLKKNPKKDLNRDGGVYFAAGLLAVLLLVYAALEWKSFHTPKAYDLSQTIDDELIEEIDLFTIETPPPPKPPVTPPVLEIVPDETEMTETVIEFIEPDPNTEVATFSEIEFKEIEEDISVSFVAVEEVPIFPGCEKASDKRACFNTMIKKHIVKNFRYPELEQEMGIQGRVYIQFEIQKDGSIGTIKMRGPNKNLEKDAARIIAKLPQMIPGKQRGKPVRVPFSIPITYRLSN